MDAGLLPVVREHAAHIPDDPVLLRAHRFLALAVFGPHLGQFVFLGPGEACLALFLLKLVPPVPQFVIAFVGGQQQLYGSRGAVVADQHVLVQRVLHQCLAGGVQRHVIPLEGLHVLAHRHEGHVRAVQQGHVEDAVTLVDALNVHQVIAQFRQPVDGAVAEQLAFRLVAHHKEVIGGFEPLIGLLVILEGLIAFHHQGVRRGVQPELIEAQAGDHGSNEYQQQGEHRMGQNGSVVEMEKSATQGTTSLMG